MALPTTSMEPLLARLLEYERGEHPPLLTGEEAMVISGLGEGPALGQLLEALAEAQAEGVIRSPAEARQWIAAGHQRSDSLPRRDGDDVPTIPE
jgi:hypothetical protein